MTRVVLSWMDTCGVDARYAQAVKDGASWERIREYSRWQDRAHRQFLAACKTLAQVRRLLKPTFAQANIAGPAQSHSLVGDPSVPGWVQAAAHRCARKGRPPTGRIAVGG